MRRNILLVVLACFSTSSVSAGSEWSGLIFDLWSRISWVRAPGACYSDDKGKAAIEELRQQRRLDANEAPAFELSQDAIISIHNIAVASVDHGQLNDGRSHFQFWFVKGDSTPQPVLVNRSGVEKIIPLLKGKCRDRLKYMFEATGSIERKVPNYRIRRLRLSRLLLVQPARHPSPRIIRTFGKAPSYFI